MNTSSPEEPARDLAYAYARRTGYLEWMVEWALRPHPAVDALEELRSAWASYEARQDW